MFYVQLAWLSFASVKITSCAFDSSRKTSELPFPVRGVFSGKGESKTIMYQYVLHLNAEDHRLVES